MRSGWVVACHRCLVAWGLDSARSFSPTKPFKTVQKANAEYARVAALPPPARHIDVWARDPKLGYVRRAWIAAPRIAGVLPLESPLCLVITADGEGLHLDLDKCKLSPVALQVTPLPPPPPLPVNPNLATQEQLGTMTKLAMRVPRADRFAIFEAANKRTDLTPRQEVELATKQLRQYIETKKPGPVVDPPPATREELRTMLDMGKQVPVAERRAIATEADKKTRLTDRDLVLWVTQQYRQYLEQHKPKPDEKK